MTIDIYYVRHGDPNYVFDALTKLGRKQAEQTSQVLKDIPFDMVFSWYHILHKEKMFLQTDEIKDRFQ